MITLRTTITNAGSINSNKNLLKRTRLTASLFPFTGWLNYFKYNVFNSLMHVQEWSSPL